jgi:hypothetical protein
MQRRADAGGLGVEIGAGLFLDRDHRHVVPKGVRGVEDQEREGAVAGNETYRGHDSGSRCSQ